VVTELAALRFPSFGLVLLAALGPVIGLAYCRWNRVSAWFAWVFWGIGVLAILTIAGAAWARVRNRVVWRGEEMRIVTEPPPGATTDPSARPLP
jgi:bacteriorhodopsin